MLSIRHLALLLTLGLALGLAGCGGDDDDGDGNNGGNGNDGGCEGSNATLLGSCAQPEGGCYEARGTYPDDFDVAADCAETDGGTWSAGEPCPASAKASGGCVMTVVGAVAVSWVPDAPEEWQPICETVGGCYLAP